MKLVLAASLLFLVLSFQFSAPAYARITPNDLYKEKMAAYESALFKIGDPVKKGLIETAASELNGVNETVCDRFEVDIARMGAILEEEKRRQGINKAIVAYGQGNTPMDSAEYYVNYAEEAVAYQKGLDYTPDITGGNLKGGVSSSMAQLTSDLGVLQGKVLRAKTEVQKALDYYNK